MEDGRFDRVRQVMQNPIDVDLPEGLAVADGVAGGKAAIEDDALPPPPPPQEGDGIDWARIEKAAACPLNDYGNGVRFVLHFGDDLIYIARVGWFVWDGLRWQKDQDEIAIRKSAHQMGGLISREVSFIGLPDDLKSEVEERDAIIERIEELELIEKPTAADKAEKASLKKAVKRIDGILDAVQGQVGLRLRHAKNAGNTGPLDNMIKEAGVQVARAVQDMDADPLRATCSNGTLQFRVERLGSGLRRATVDFLSHSREHLITKLMPVVYDPDAPMREYQKFLNRIMPDPEAQGFLQRIFGLAMLGVTEQAIFYLYGDGANGKSVLLDAIAAILGDNAAMAKIETLTGVNRRGGGDATPDLVPLINARMGRASEPEKGVVWQEGLIKELTGGEPMLIRALQKDFVEVRLFIKLFVSGNHKPKFQGTDEGIWRRVKLVHFAEQIPEGERLPKAEMDAKLAAEASGILNWMIEGALNYLEGGLMEPASVRNATQELREESDPVGAFLEDACVVTGEEFDRIGSSELVHSFQYWLGLRGEAHWRQRKAQDELTDHARRWRSRKTGQKFAKGKCDGLMVYSGLRFTEFFGRMWSAAPKDVSGRALTSVAASTPVRSGQEDD